MNTENSYVKAQLRPQATEHQQQAALFQWARHPATLRKYPDLKYFFAIPNGSKVPYKKMVNKRTGKSFSYAPERLKLLDEGLLPGVSDTCLPVSRGTYHSLWIEMKAGDNEPTKEQYLWLADMLKVGNYADFCNDWEVARSILEWYLSL